MKDGFPIFKFLSLIAIAIMILVVLGVPLPFLPQPCNRLFAPRHSIYIPPHYCYVNNGERNILFDISTGTFH